MSIILKIAAVPVIMVAATGGTVGVMKLLKRFVPGMTDENGEFRESRTAQKLHEAEARKTL